MLIESKRLITGVTTDRRALLRGVGTLGLSAAAVAVLGGCESMAASTSASAADVDILNVALGLEHEAINAYQLGAESGLLGACPSNPTHERMIQDRDQQHAESCVCDRPMIRMIHFRATF